MIRHRRRVLWWVPAAPPSIGGVESLITGLVPRLADAGWEAHLLVTCGGPNDERLGDVQVFRRPLDLIDRATDEDVLRLRRTVGEIKALVDPDINHLHLIGPESMLHLMTEASGHGPTPTAITLHVEPEQDDHDGAAIGPAQRQLLGRADALVAVSSGVAAQYAQLIPGTPPLTTIPNGVEIPRHHEPLPDEPRLLAAGRFVPQKGFDRLIDALPTIRAEVPDVAVRFVGVGPLEAQLRTRAEQLSVSDVIEFAGAADTTQMRSHLGWSRVVAVPSRYEGFGLIAAEAAAAGRPVVASAAAGLDEVVADGTTGIVLPRTRHGCAPSDLAVAVIGLLGPGRRARDFGAAARRRAVERYSIERCASDHVALYERLTQ